MTSSEVLRRAAEQIRRGGWSQFSAVSYCDGGMCMAAAIRHAAGLSATSGETPQQFLPHIPAIRAIFQSVWGDSVVRFNNYHCETADDAVAALEIAADLAECEGV